MLGTQTQGGRMVGTDESTELWRHPINFIYSNKMLYSISVTYIKLMLMNVRDIWDFKKALSLSLSFNLNQLFKMFYLSIPEGQNMLENVSMEINALQNFY